jgi:serine/threonine protein kinase
MLSPGTTLGPYEIVGSLGAGGMGEVYRARDTRLQRDVAIKVLPGVSATDPERLARFEREAQAVAALSHPNILAIHDFGVALLSSGADARPDQVVYAVTELLEGETLRERLTPPSGAKATTGLPIRKIIEYGIQIAQGLGAAHDKGLVHRDLKPENIFISKDGHVKILDFGLARQTTAVPASGVSMAATLAVAHETIPGVVLGTIGYMSPEQVRGVPVDARSDIFAFGAVLYEMMTARRAFQRDTAAETMTAILKEDPAASVEGSADLSPALDRIVRHCLEKSPAERFQSARDIAFALQSLSGSSLSAPSVAASVGGRRRWLRPVLAALAVGAAVAAGVAIGRRMGARPDASVSFATITFEPQFIVSARFAPDGQTIVYSAALEGNTPELFVSRPGTLMPQALGVRPAALLSVSSVDDARAYAYTYWKRVATLVVVKGAR